MPAAAGAVAAGEAVGETAAGVIAGAAVGLGDSGSRSLSLSDSMDAT